MIVLSKRHLTDHEKESFKCICAKMDIFELRNLAKEMGISKAHNYNKNELIDMIVKKQTVVKNSL